MATMHDNNETVVWPKRAVVTAGMPYGNKPLHFGHIAGVFVPADCFARFLRDRIGAENVRFISGTDCFGSPINEGYRKLVEAGQFDGTIEGITCCATTTIKRTRWIPMTSALISTEGSNIGHSGEVHQLISEAFIRSCMRTAGCRSARRCSSTTPGGHVPERPPGTEPLPVQGCKSEHAYADECDLGHSYAPEDLIAPGSPRSPASRPRCARWRTGTSTCRRSTPS